MYEFAFFDDMRAKAMAKPGVAHKKSYEFTLIQKKLGSDSEPDSESESESESENFTAKCDMNRL